MKRTTYVMIGMLLAGLVVIGSFVFSASERNVAWEDTFMEIGGERKTVPLPSCRVVKLQSPAEWEQEQRGIVEAKSVYSFRQVPLEVTPADSLQGSFSYASGMDSFMSMITVGDTLLIAFNFPDDKIEARFRNESWIKVRSAGMALSLPASVQTVVVGVESMETSFRGFRCDTLSFQVRDLAKVEDCRIASLAAQAQTLDFNSGEVDNLYLNLDKVSNWKVKVDSFRIDTEYLTGSHKNYSTLQKGECRRVFWTPLEEGASLKVDLKQAVKIELGERP